MIEIIKNDIKKLIVQHYKVNPLLFTNQTDVFSYPIYMKARDVLYVIFSISQKYNITLSMDMSSYKLISIDTLADFLNNCKK